MIEEFDEIALVSKLSELEFRAKVAFAAACAGRLLASSRSLDAALLEMKMDYLERMLESVWSSVEGGTVEAKDWIQAEAEVLAAIPSGTMSWKLSDGILEDALASLAYTIRCIISQEAQEAAWAARRAYEASDQAAIYLSRIELATPDAETIIRSHPIVQRELQRQSRDRRELEQTELAVAIAAIRARSREERVLSRSEFREDLV